MADIDSAPKSVGAIIPAAGFSKRMGRYKPFLRYDENRLFIHKIIDEYLNFNCASIVVTINNLSEWNNIAESYFNEERVKFIPNNHPEYERFYSIKLAAQNLPEIDFCYLQNIDNPFINYQILERLYSSRIYNEYTVPVHNGKGGHPVLLHKQIINAIRNEISNSLNFKEILKNFNRNDVPFANDIILININDIEEYNKYFNDCIY